VRLGNNRVQVFGPEGQYITGFTGDAQELSKWAKMTVDASPETIKRRREVRSLESEWRFAFPTGVTFDPKKNRLIVADSQRHRLQIYNKVQEYLEPQRAL
jgi:sugar lactone lactonase YvrE